MTVASATARTGPLDCNGSVTEFAGLFKILDESHVTVTKADADLNEETLSLAGGDYTVTNITSTGFTVTTAETYSSDYTITLTRNVPATQDTSYGNQGPYLPENHEESYDKLTMLVQQALEKLNRCVQLPVSVSGSITIVLDEDGTVVTGYLQDGSVTTVKLADNAVTTDKIVDDAVTYSKIQNVSATDKLLGRSTAGAGVVEEIACTAAGRALLDDASATEQRATLGLGGASLLGVGQTAGTVAAGNDDRFVNTNGFVQWDSGTGVPAINDGLNLDGVVDEGTGDITFTITTDYSDTNYKLMPCVMDSSQNLVMTCTAKAVGSFRFKFVQNAGGAVDPDIGFSICVIQ